MINAIFVILKTLNLKANKDEEKNKRGFFSAHKRGLM